MFTPDPRAGGVLPFDGRVLIRVIASQLAASGVDSPEHAAAEYLASLQAQAATLDAVEAKFYWRMVKAHIQALALMSQQTDRERRMPLGVADRCVGQFRQSAEMLTEYRQAVAEGDANPSSAKGGSMPMRGKSIQNGATNKDGSTASPENIRNVATNKDGSAPAPPQNVQNIATNKDGSTATPENARNVATNKDASTTAPQNVRNVATNKDGSAPTPENAQNIATNKDASTTAPEHARNVATNKDGSTVAPQNVQNVATNKDGSAPAPQNVQNVATNKDGPITAPQNVQNIATNKDASTPAPKNSRNVQTNKDCRAGGVRINYPTKAAPDCGNPPVSGRRGG